MDSLTEHIDFYYDENGLMVLTEAYLKRRGHCCENGCRHCPYKNTTLGDTMNKTEPTGAAKHVRR